MPNRVTMSNVAHEAGVFLIAVSRVNSKGDVSSETRQRVFEIISEPGYRPSAIARSLATKETSTIGLVAAQDSLDNDRCGRIAAEHLVRSGAGIELLEGWIRPCHPSVEAGYEATRRLLGMYPRLTALFCFNDLVVPGAPQLLAIKIDDRPLDSIIHRLDPFTPAPYRRCGVKGQLKLLGIDSREDPPKHIVRRKSIRQLQKGLQPRQTALPKQFNIYPASRSADQRTNGNPHDLNYSSVPHAGR